MKHLFKYVNSVYHLREKFNSLIDKRKRRTIPFKNIIIPVFTSLLLQYKSFNEIFTYKTTLNRIKHYTKGAIPKTDAVRDVLELVEKDIQSIKQINESVVRTIYENKTMRGGTIDGHVVVAVDGVELFTSANKKCSECLTRKLQNGKLEYFHRSVVCMTVGSDPHIIIGEDMLHPRDGNQKDEGELTGGIRLIKDLYKRHHHFAVIIVADALYLKAPFINTVLSKGMDVVIRAKDENRLIIQDALGLFRKGEGKKESFEKNNIKVEAWDLGGFELTGVNEKLRFLQFKEQHPKEKKERIVWVVTSSNADYKIIWEIMHKRWDIEENGFHQLKTYYHADHCFDHRAVETIFLLNILAFNIREMYLYRRLKNYRNSKITRREITEMFRDELLVYNYTELWGTG